MLCEVTTCISTQINEVLTVITHTDVQNSLGLTNNGVVYALFSYQASDSDELGFHEREVLHVVEHKGRADRWWWAEN